MTSSILPKLVVAFLVARFIVPTSFKIIFWGYYWCKGAIVANRYEKQAMAMGRLHGFGSRQHRDAEDRASTGHLLRLRAASNFPWS